MQTGFDTAFILLGNIFLLAIWQLWWFYVLLFMVVSSGIFIFCRLRLNAVKDQKAGLEMQVLERTELLEHATQNEQKARDEADNANRSKSLLLSKLSHDIRTPMNAVMGMASLLTETSLTAEQQSYASTILSSGNRLLTVINDILMKDILEFSKIESGKELESKDFDLRNSIEEVLDVFAAKAAAAGLDLLYSIDNDVPAQIVGDSLRLRQILMNLVDNAFRFTTAGDIFIGVHAAGGDNDSDIMLEFEVRDTGSGIAPDVLRLISKDLLQPDNAGKPHRIGLSLIICKRLVALMGGAIRVESTPGSTTTFRFDIKTRISHYRLHSQIHQETAGMEGKKILIVDDNLNACNLLKHHLEYVHAMALVATSADEALNLLKTSSGFHLVLTDLDLDKMNGIQLAHAIRDMQPGLPVILLNKTGDQSHLQHPSLFTSVLTKPVKQHLLYNQVSGALRKTQKADVKNNVQEKQNLSVDFAKQFPLSILFAEDDRFNQMLISTVLNKLGYKPHIAGNGNVVLEMVSQKSYDIILMDVQMPEMDGLEATRMIRLCISAQPIIIAMTANTLQGDREACLRAGMDDYISKPLNLEELAGMLEKWYYTVVKKAPCFQMLCNEFPDQHVTCV